MMKLQLICIVVAFLLLTIKSNSFNYSLIKDFQRFKSIRTSLILTCEAAPVSITSLIKNLQYDGIWFNILDISNADLSEVNFEDFFARWSCTHNVICNLKCNQSMRLFNEISKLKMFHYERHWLVFSDSVDQTTNLLGKQNINSDAEITVVIQKDKREYNLYDVYNPSWENHGRLNITKVGNWNNSKGLEFLQTQTKIERRRNFGGLTFRAVITLPKPIRNKTFLEHINSVENVEKDSIDRFNYQLFRLIMQMFNFKMLVYRANIWGLKEPNGRWHGSIGMINRSEVDIMISGVRWDNERYGAFDQTTNSYFFHVMFIFRHPKSVDAAKVFVSSFEPNVWLCVIFLGIFIAFGMRMAFTIENRNSVQDELKELGNDKSFSNCILLVFGYIFQQGYSGNPLLISTRLFTSAILVFSMLIYQFYGAFIVGDLLSESPKTITNVKKLLDSNLHIYIDDIPYVLENFKRSKDIPTEQLYNKVMRQSSTLMPLYKGLQKVKEGYVFNTDASYAYLILKSMLSDNEICDLQEIQYQDKLQCGPGVPKKSHLRELIKISLRKMHETGIMAYHWKIWMGLKPKCESNDLDVMPVDIVHFSSALYALIGGMQISLGFLIGEKLFNRFRL